MGSRKHEEKAFSRPTLFSMYHSELVRKSASLEVLGRGHYKITILLALWASEGGHGNPPIHHASCIVL